MRRRKDYYLILEDVQSLRAIKATAFREIEDMHSKGLLTRLGSERSVRYELDGGVNQP
ncbi:hypothetical protein [Treponema primitia]|nr:hypothetical protein [Treponema primitia]